MKMLWLMGALAALLFVAGPTLVAARNVEEPSYRSVSLDGAFEVRDYPELTVAEVTRQGERRDAVSAGFGPLAGYIFAKERAGAKIAMTAPVTQTAEDSGGAWAVRFIMPSQYTLETLPIPAGTDIRLETLPAQRMAAVTFSGYARDRKVAEQEAKLMAWIEEQGLTPTGLPTYAYYNPPWIPGPFRRNEILVPVSVDATQ